MTMASQPFPTRRIGVRAQRTAPPSETTALNKARIPLARFLESTTLEATQGQILGQSPTDATRFWWHLYESRLKKPSVCPWVASREGDDA